MKFTESDFSISVVLFSCLLLNEYNCSHRTERVLKKSADNRLMLWFVYCGGSSYFSTSSISEEDQGSLQLKSIRISLFLKLTIDKTQISGCHNKCNVILIFY